MFTDYARQCDKGIHCKCFNLKWKMRSEYFQLGEITSLTPLCNIFLKFVDISMRTKGWEKRIFLAYLYTSSPARKMLYTYSMSCLNTAGPKRKGCHFEDDIFKSIPAAQNQMTSVGNLVNLLEVSWHWWSAVLVWSILTSLFFCIFKK